MEWQLSQTPVNFSNKIEYKLLCEKADDNLGIGSKGLTYVKHTLFHLQLDGHFEFDKAENDSMPVQITPKGASHYTGRVFKIKQDEVFWKAFMNISITIANIIVAIVAVWALTKDGGELQQIKERLKILEAAQHKEVGITNPNIQQNKSASTSDAKKQIFFSDTLDSAKYKR
jgi:hypothetical protein